MCLCVLGVFFKAYGPLVLDTGDSGSLIIGEVCCGAMLELSVDTINHTQTYTEHTSTNPSAHKGYHNTNIANYVDDTMTN